MLYTQSTSTESEKKDGRERESEKVSIFPSPSNDGDWFDEKWNISHFQFQLFMFWLHHLHNHQLEEAAGQNPKQNLIQMGHGGLEETGISYSFTYSVMELELSGSRTHTLAPLLTLKLTVSPSTRTWWILVQAWSFSVSNDSVPAEKVIIQLWKKNYTSSPHLFIFVSTHVHNVYT